MAWPAATKWVVGAAVHHQLDEHRACFPAGVVPPESICRGSRHEHDEQAELGHGARQGGEENAQRGGGEQVERGAGEKQRHRALDRHPQRPLDNEEASERPVAISTTSPMDQTLATP